MRRIVIDARESGTGTGRYIDKLIEYLYKLKPTDEIIVLTKAARVDFFHSIAPNFKVEVADYKEFSLAEQLGFALKLYRLRAKLVHFNAPQQPILYLGRSVTTIHDLTTIRFNNPSKNWLVFKFKQLVYRGVVRLTAHKSKALIAISKFAKKDLIEFARVEPGKVTVTYEAADVITEPAKPVANLAGRRFIMYVGRPLPHKNLRRLIDTFASLQKTHPELRLVLVGKKDVLYERHEQYVRNHKIQNVIFTGFINEEQLRWLYENTAAYIFPSLSEGFGLPALEAMAHGAPVVSSNATCLPEIYGDAALYFNPLDTADIAAKIEQVLSDENLRKSLVQKGATRVKQYSWAKMAEQTLAVYARVLG